MLVFKMKIGGVPVPLEREPLSLSYLIISANNYKKKRHLIKLEKDVLLSDFNVAQDKKSNKMNREALRG